jgi:hypothetical protein
VELRVNRERRNRGHGSGTLIASLQALLSIVNSLNMYLFFYFPTFSQAALLIFVSIHVRFSPLPISAITGTGTGDLLDLVCSELTKFKVLKL